MQKKHGLPGVGITGTPGIRGVEGSGTYFGYIEEFFVDDENNYVNILNPKYKEGDIIYCWSEQIPVDQTKSNVQMMVYVTKQLEGCTKAEFVNNSLISDPFKFQSFEINTDSSRVYINRPLDIVNLDKANISNNNLYNAYADNLQKLITDQHSPNIAIGANVYNQTQISIADGSRIYGDYVFPIFYDPSRNELDEINNVIYNGDNQYVFKTSVDNSIALVKMYDTKGNNLDIQPEIHNSIKVISDKIKASNIYVKDNNIGNLDTYDVLVTNGLWLDMEQNSYTLQESDYDISSFIFTIDKSKLFTDTPKWYRHGYIHNYWNYNDNTPDSSFDSNYRPSYIHLTDTSVIMVNEPVLNKYGGYIRDWESIKDVSDYNLKEILSNIYDVSTYNGYNGIIVTEPVQHEIEVNYKLDYDSSAEYDPSFFSGNEIVTDPSSDKIYLAILDPSGNMYRHHDIVHWVMNERGIKFYSKHTYADFNYYSNRFDITTDKLSDYIKIVKDLGIVTYNITGMSSQQCTGLVEIMCSSVLDSDITYVDDSSADRAITWATVDINSYEVRSGNVIAGVTVNANSNLPNNIQTIKQYLKEYTGNTLFNNIYNNNIQNTKSRDLTVSTKYTIPGDKNTYVSQTYVIQPGYTEMRTIPKIHLDMHNQLEDIEQCNKSENGILCNQVQFFMDVSISDFDMSNWGKYNNIVSDVQLDFKISATLQNEDKEDQNDMFTKESFRKLISGQVEPVNVKLSVLDASVDIFNFTVNQLNDINNMVDDDFVTINTPSYTLTGATGTYLPVISFKDITIDKAGSGKFKLRISVDMKNPELLKTYFKFYVSELSVHYKIDNTKYTFSLAPDILVKTVDSYYKYLYKSEALKFVIAPVSYTLIPEKIQSADLDEYKVRLTSTKHYHGTEELVKVGLDLYADMDSIDENDVSYVNIKKRYLQDNIQNINITPININDFTGKIAIDPQLNTLIKNDEDDIEYDYVAMTYNSRLLNPKLLHDEFSVIYNSSIYLSSKYSQYTNNTAIFIKQDEDYELRDSRLLLSIEHYNKQYKLYEYAPDKKNLFNGHIEAVGNGYNYIKGDIEDDDRLYPLDYTREQNEELVFNGELYSVLDYEQKSKIYQPDTDKIFRTLLYNIKWQYPMYNYDSIDDITTVTAYDISTNISSTTYPYNLAYKIYPRSLFNDQDLFNIIFMLRCPSVVREGQYQMTKEDICLKYVMNLSDDEPFNQTNPLNVLY